MATKRAPSSSERTTTIVSPGIRDPLPRRTVVRAVLLASALLTAIALFIWLLQTTARGGADAFDRAVVEWIAGRQTHVLTIIAIDVTALGSRTLLAVGTCAAVLIFWTGGRRLAAVDTALASTASALVTRSVKVLLGRPRPSLAPLVDVGGFSFPSGHSSGIAALLTSITLHTFEVARTGAQRAVLATLWALVMALVGWSRVYLGVHYPSDVVAGLCVGVGSSLFAHGLLRTRTALRLVRQLLARRRTA